MQALGLSPEFKDKTSEIGSILKMFFGLPLLPPDQVMGCYIEDLFALKPEGNQQLIEFFDYICANYLDGGHSPQKRGLICRVHAIAPRTAANLSTQNLMLSSRLLILTFSISWKF